MTKKDKQQKKETSEKVGFSSEETAAERANTNLLAEMSCEIRTPINAIIGFSELLFDDGLTEEQKLNIKFIRENANDLLQLINNVLDFSMIEAGTLRIKIAECSMGYIFAVIESAMRPTAKEKGLKFGVRQSGELPARIRTDSGRLTQCLFNIIGNAIRYTNSGHVYINISCEQSQGQNFIRFDVEDTGIGIDTQKQNSIFERPVNTCREVHSPKILSLGLPITKELTELLGGRLSLKSEVGRGSIFSLIIPANVDVEQEQPFKKLCHTDLADTADKEQTAVLAGRILAVEDSPSNQMLIDILLKQQELETTIANDGEEAVAKALSDSFDLILMDMQMPNMNGYDATRILRKKGVTTPIIALTAQAMQGDREKCLAAGCDDYLPKPIKRDELIQVVRKHLSSKNIASDERTDSAVLMIASGLAQV